MVALSAKDKVASCLDARSKLLAFALKDEFKQLRDRSSILADLRLR